MYTYDLLQSILTVREAFPLYLNFQVIRIINQTHEMGHDHTSFSFRMEDLRNISEVSKESSG